jgi:hypothetical protein
VTGRVLRLADEGKVIPVPDAQVPPKRGRDPGPVIRGPLIGQDRHQVPGLMRGRQKTQKAARSSVPHLVWHSRGADEPSRLSPSDNAPMSRIRPKWAAQTHICDFMDVQHNTERTPRQSWSSRLHNSTTRRGGPPPEGVYEQRVVGAWVLIRRAKTGRGSAPGATLCRSGRRAGPVSSSSAGSCITTAGSDRHQRATRWGSRRWENPLRKALSQSAPGPPLRQRPILSGPVGIQHAEPTVQPDLPKAWIPKPTIVGRPVKYPDPHLASPVCMFHLCGVYQVPDQKGEEIASGSPRLLLWGRFCRALQSVAHEEKPWLRGLKVGNLLLQSKPLPRSLAPRLSPPRREMVRPFRRERAPSLTPLQKALCETRSPKAHKMFAAGGWDRFCPIRRHHTKCPPWETTERRPTYLSMLHLMYQSSLNPPLAIIRQVVMAGLLAGTAPVRLPDLARLEAPPRSERDEEEESFRGPCPKRVLTCHLDTDGPAQLSSYTPSEGGPPRLVVLLHTPPADRWLGVRPVLHHVYMILIQYLLARPMVSVSLPLAHDRKGSGGLSTRNVN